MAGGDFLVAARCNVRVDPEGNRSAPVGLAGDAIDDLEFGVGFDIELEDVRGHRLADFALRLADSGKHDAFAWNPCPPGPVQFAAGHHVGACAEIGQQPQYRQVGVRLEGVRDQRIQTVERILEDAVMTAQRCRRVDIDRGSDFAGNIR